MIDCWCGARGTFDELFAPLPDTCRGYGYLTCECSGDGLCVCHNHGEVECLGCEDEEDEARQDSEDWENDRQ